MKLWPFTTPVLEAKENPIGAALVMSGGGAWQPAKSKRQYITEGYQLNTVVYRAVREITGAIGDLTVEVHGNGEVLADHPALTLLNRPNPMQGYDGFIKEAFTNYLLLGEKCIIGTGEAIPVELWNVSPLDVYVSPGRGGMPAAYVHDLNNYKTTFKVDSLTGKSDMFFMKMINPNDYWRGQSPLMAASLPADTHNAGMKWNYKLLKNSARPSGMVKFAGSPSGEILARMREYFKKAVQGEDNAGEIPMLTGGAEWVSMDNNPRDMDFVTTQKEAAKLVASAFGVPLPLIDNDASTFNNLEQAKERFYTDTVIPMFNEFLAQFGNWLLPRYGDGLRFATNMDDIPALEGVRTRTFDRMTKAVQGGVLTVDEAREAIGYAPLGGASAILDPIGSAVFGAGTSNNEKALAALVYGETK
jgi:HK97 family phage portal protein